LVTASIDNVICFWNSFSGVESKKIELPTEIADQTKGKCIQHVRYPFPKKKDLLLVIINNGDCFMVETQTERFMEFKQTQMVLQSDSDEDKVELQSTNFLMGKVGKFPIIDNAGDFLVSSNENGRGQLNLLKFNHRAGGKPGQRMLSAPAGGRVSNEACPVQFEELHKFKISDDIDSSNTVF